MKKKRPFVINRKQRINAESETINSSQIPLALQKGSLGRVPLLQSAKQQVPEMGQGIHSRPALGVGVLTASRGRLQTRPHWELWECGQEAPRGPLTAGCLGRVPEPPQASVFRPV